MVGVGVMVGGGDVGVGKRGKSAVSINVQLIVMQLTYRSRSPFLSQSIIINTTATLSLDKSKGC